MIPTREIFWNVSTLGHWAPYVLMVIMLGIVAWGFRRRWLLWDLGKGGPSFDRLGERIRSFLVHGPAHGRLLVQRFGGAMHLLIFWGFVVLFIGTTLVFIHEDLRIHFLQGAFYLYFSFFLDVFGLGAVIGILMAAGRRYLARPDKLDNQWDNGVTLSLVLVVLVTGYLVEAFRMAATELAQNPDLALWSPVGYVIANVLYGWNAQEAFLRSGHALVWWFHLVASMSLQAYVGWYFLSHVAYSGMSVFFRNLAPQGALPPIVDFKDKTNLGAGRIVDLSWKDLLDLDACTRCGRCQEGCPAYASGKPLSPKKVVQDLKGHLTAFGPRWLADRGYSGEGVPLPGGGAVTYDETWACTTCGNCHQQCPVFIQPMAKIMELRRHMTLVQGKLDSTAQGSLQSIQKRSHPWSGTQATRIDWAEGLGLPEYSQGAKTEYLLWVGCTSALVDLNAKAAASSARLLRAGGVSFAILGEEEACTGDPARRMGNEYLFQLMARKNIKTFQKYEIDKIITLCPHCYNTLKNEYPQFGGNYQVLHYSQVLSRLLRDGALKVGGQADGVFTYHDACYLGRYNNLFQPPREVLKSVPGLSLVEMKLSRERSFCCGAGGGRVWMEEKIGRRINEMRVQQAADTGATTIATACPFCLQMMDAGIRDQKMESRLRAMDLSQVLEQAVGMETGPRLPTPGSAA
ncbi:MAG: (Fe-S)-binding protein [Dehalococcoidia bacterium]|nr:(Fe-S)-binding protein [Dehalococcoidia bacterium]